MSHILEHTTPLKTAEYRTAKVAASRSLVEEIWIYHNAAEAHEAVSNKPAGTIWEHFTPETSSQRG